MKLFPGVLLSETAAHRFGSVGRAVDASQRLPAETLDAFSPHFCGTECPLGRGDGAMDLKLLLLIALLAPVLMLATGFFARRENAGQDIAEATRAADQQEPSAPCARKQAVPAAMFRSDQEQRIGHGDT